MRIDIITLFPETMQSVFGHSILQRAQNKGIVEVGIHNLRDYATNRYKRIDDYPYGGDAGMLICIEPVANCIDALKAQHNYDEIIYTSPDGQPLTQAVANHYSLKGNLLFLCGHYKGIDERIREHFITQEISIGDYVLSGGELAVAVICDAIVRVIPGVLNDETSALTDSFQNQLISPPAYTRPAEFRGWKVPEILLSGNDKLIEQWQLEQSIERTKQRRPDLWESLNS